MNEDYKFSNILKVNIDDHLASFLMTILGSHREPVRVYRKSFIGDLLYRLIDKVPENCNYREPVLRNKRLLQIELGWLGFRDEQRKNPYTYIYFPLSKQREFESAIRSLFDNVFFNVIEISHEYTDQQYKILIDKFCERYHIDFVRHFDSLKKKHYRSRMESLETEKNLVHGCPVKKTD
ncbi:MAG: hypothetical protein LBI65_01790 [Candidatus Symbiothrix sp.]|jgi:hypothetical protein|nr:hypothetical protein [Candidatus Symbiothrix sp.]